MWRRPAIGDQTNRKIRYPSKDKRFFPLYWPAQAVSVERGRIVSAFGALRPSLVLHLQLPAQIGGCKLVWKDGYELQVWSPHGSGSTGCGTGAGHRRVSARSIRRR